MQDPSLSPETVEALSRHFDETGALPVRHERRTLEDVRRFLVERIAPLLDRNPSLLMSILYRVDVAERDVQRVLQEAPPGAIPFELADLLIARQLQKVRTRRAYDGGRDDVSQP